MKLRESEDMYKTLFDYSLYCIYIHDFEGRFIDANDTALNLLGYKREDISSVNFSSLLEKDRISFAFKNLENLLQTGSQHKPIEYKLRKKDGGFVWIEAEGAVIYKNGKPSAIQGIARDITDRKRAEKALRASEEKFRILAETNTAAIVIFQGEKFCYVNSATEALTGYTKEELQKKNFGDFIHPEFRQLMKEREFMRQQGEKVDPISEFKIITKSGELRWVTTTGGIIEYNGKPATIGTAFDITERKNVEAALRESEINFRTLSDNALMGIYKTSLKGDILYANKALVRMLEFDSIEELLLFGVNKTYKKSDDRKALIEAIKKSGKVSNFETELLTKKGNVKYVILNATLEDDIISGMILDISERKQVEEELLESEKRFRAIFESASDGILVTDIKTKKFIFGNKKICQMLGYREDEIKKLTVMDIHPEKDLLYVLKQFDKLVKGEITLIETIPVMRKDGFIFYADISTFWLTLAGKEYMTGIFRDITERKQAEEALRESEDRYRTLFEESRDAIYITTREGKFVNVNQSMLDLFGYATDEMLILNALQIYVNPNDRNHFQQEIEQMGSVRDYEVQFLKKDGTVMDCLLTSTVRRSFDGNILGYQGIIRDITQRKQAENQLKYLGLHDSLTGLYNRAYFEEEMRRLKSRRFSPVGLLICDIDGLKLINDALGHDKGDKLLLATANVLRESFREGDMVARVGGDEFAVLFPNSDRDALDRATQRIRHAVTKYNKEIIEFPLSISIGSAIAVDVSINMGDLFKEADNNMYREKLQHSQSTRSTIVKTLMKTMEARDFITEGHAVRLKDMVAAIANAIGLPERCVNDLRLLAQFHDIGKVGIPDRILFKPGPFTPEEHTEMQWHCEIGHRIALSAPDLSPIVDLILKHHEWWDGQGYPLGLKGEEIPVECRILAIADAYDAMTSDRPYRKAESHEQAVNELRRCAGTQFDPELVSKLIEVMEERNTDKK